MHKIKAVLIISAATLSLLACATQPTPQVPSGPLPAIEIVAGAPDTCQMADTTQSTVMGFDVIYHNVGTDAFMIGLMSAPDVGAIGAVDTPGEGRDGEASWGIYPEFYDLPPNTPITLKIMVYAGADETAPLTSTSTLTYDCTTGETLSSTFEEATN